jgi:chemotaxis response regulator CheB
MDEAASGCGRDEMTERAGRSTLVRVLVVDDNVPCRRAACDVVRAAAGFDLAGAARSGEEAVELAVLLQPDLVLLDIRMDGINGFEASRRILALQPETVVVLVSAWADEAAAGGERSGAAATLHKRDLKPAVLGDLWDRYGGPAAAA